MTTPCGSCGVDIEVAQAGNYKCPRCSAVFHADASGNVRFYGTSRPLPYQLVMVTGEAGGAALKAFVGELARNVGFAPEQTTAIQKAMEEVARIITDNVYPSENTYAVMAIPEPNALSLTFSDHGKTLSAEFVKSAFTQASSAFDEFDVSPHPRGGNIIRFTKRK